MAAKNSILKYLLVFGLLAMTFAVDPINAEHKPGKGITARFVEGANLEEKFQHQIIYRALE